MNIINSAEGTVANFITNLAKPLASSKYGIEATQDLNGQTGPYPPGGGTNLIDFEEKVPEGWTNSENGITATYSKGFMRVTGTSTSSGWTNIVQFANTWSASPKPLGPGTYISSDSNLVIRCKVDEEEYRNRADAITVTTSLLIQGFYIAVRAGATVDWNIPMMFVKSSTRPATWSPYSNICPIVGVDTVNGYHRGKNWLKNIIAPGQSANYILLGQTNTNKHETRLKAGTYTINYKTRSSNIPSIYLKKQGVSGNVKLSNYDTKATFTVDDGTYRFWLYKSNGINYEDVYDAQIELIPNQFNKANYQNLRTDYEYLYNSYYCKEIQLKPNTTYTVSQNAGTTSTCTILIHNNRQVNATGYFDLRLASSIKDFTTDDTGKLYVGVVSTIADWEYNNRVNKCGVSIIEKNVTATAYEPYQGEEQSISLVPALYTLYPEYAPYFQGLLAGTHDFVQLSGLTWYAVAVTGAGNRFYAPCADIKPPADTSSEAHIICSKYKIKPVSQYNQAVDGITIYTNKTIQIYDSNLKLLTNTEFKSAMSKVYAIYELETPKTPTITEDQFKMLLQAFGATCYGGEVITTESGASKLKATHKSIEINPNNPNCGDILMYGTYVPSTGKGNFFYTTTKSEWGWSNNGANDGISCDSLAIKQQVSQADTTSGISWLSPSGIIRWKDTARMNMSIDDYKEYLKEHPIKCTYKLATPLIIDLPDGLLFSTYIGTNNIFCDTGDTTVQYYISVVMDSMESNLVPGEDIKSINVSQNDAGRKVRVSLFNNSVVYNVPSGYVVTGKILTPNHEIVDVEIDDIGDSYVDITIPEEAVSSCGTAMCKLRVKDSEEHPLYDVGFSTFFIKVEPAP